MENQKINNDMGTEPLVNSEEAPAARSQLEKFKTNKRFWLVLSGIFILTAAALLIVNFKLFTANDAKTSKKNISQTIDSNEQRTAEQARLVRRAIDGVFVKEGSENIYPAAVMIENHVDSRPPSSLSKANLVFEAEAEGSITRFLAIYADGQNLDEIGPIRSARPYFVDWAQEFDALYVHCGGSPDALVKIKQDNVNDLNEFYNGKYYWRADDKSAPHNVYTSSELIGEAIKFKELDEALYESWKYKNDNKPEESTGTSSVIINFRAKLFVVEWKYNRASNDYERYMGGEPHKDKSGEVVTAKNVAVEYVNAKVLDEELRMEVDNIGTGKAIICLDGRCEAGEWRKPSTTERTRFYAKASSSDATIENENWREVEFNAGTTWIEVVRKGYKVSY